MANAETLVVSSASGRLGQLVIADLPTRGVPNFVSTTCEPDKLMSNIRTDSGQQSNTSYRCTSRAREAEQAS